MFQPSATVTVFFGVFSNSLACGQIFFPKPTCGPKECNIQCGPTDKCVQNNNIQCITSPCCPQWSCQGCPASQPDFGSKCDVSQDGLQCDFGSQVCCGEKFPEVKMQCDGSNWQGYFVDTICMFAGNTCPTTTTTTPSSCICIEIYAPVCGFNNQTYDNSCFAGCAKEKIACQGSCPCPQDCICTAEYAPVCGVSGETYSNSCKAACARDKVQCQGECPCSK